MKYEEKLLLYLQSLSLVVSLLVQALQVLLQPKYPKLSLKLKQVLLLTLKKIIHQFQMLMESLTKYLPLGKKPLTIQMIWLISTKMASGTEMECSLSCTMKGF